MTINTETSLFKAKLRQWRSIHSGWLAIEPAKLLIYRQPLFGKPREARNFELDYMRDIEEDVAHNGVKVTLEVLGGTTSEVFYFFNKNDAQTAYEILSKLLKDAEDEKNRKAEELARLQQKEREEHQRQVRENFIQDVWETTETIWLLVKADYSMADAVITNNWNEAKRQYSNIWQQADRLKSAHQVELTVPLQELDEKMCTEDGGEAIKKAALVLGSLANQVLQTEIFWDTWRKNGDVTFPITPNWNHVPYFLLFSAWYFETIISLRIEDWVGVNNGVSILQTTSDVLCKCYNIDFDGLLDSAKLASDERNAELLTRTTRHLESALVASFKTRRFEYTTMEQ